MTGEAKETASQGEVIRFLSSPAAYGLDRDEAVVRHETHVSVVFLAGDRAYKLKRAVRFPFLDFRTLDQRRAACETEIAINRRTAPDIYRRVAAVTRAVSGGALALDGDGAVVDWLVEMRRFDEAGMFDRLAGEGRLDRKTMENLADAIADFHAVATPAADFGGAAGTRMIIDNNDASFHEHGGALFDAAAVEALTGRSRAAHERVAELLDDRRAAGRVRHCHGDLHLRNICMIDGRPVLFDAIEFNEEFSHIDVLYDLAFLLMDLDFRGLRRLASVVLNRYMDRAPLGAADPEGLAALPLFLSMRAAVRAHVGAAQVAAVDNPATRAPRAAEANAYFEKARDYLNPPAPRLIAVGGLSGSGKSRLAREVAPHLGAVPGARVVRTDVKRKHLAGTNLHDRLPATAYTPEMSERTYAACMDEARAALAAGQAVVFDAVCARPAERQAVEALAGEAGVPFHGIWVDAPIEVRLARVSGRRANVSDADAAVARKQMEYDLGDITWDTVDSSGAKEKTVAEAVRALGIRPA